MTATPTMPMKVKIKKVFKNTPRDDGLWKAQSYNRHHAGQDRSQGGATAPVIWMLEYPRGQGHSYFLSRLDGC